MTRNLVENETNPCKHITAKEKEKQHNHQFKQPV